MEKNTMEKKNTTFGGAFLAGAITLSWMTSAQTETSLECASRLLRTAPQIMEHQEEPFQPLNGSFTHVVYDPERAKPFTEEIDLTVREVNDTDGVNDILAHICELCKDSADREQVISLLMRLLAPRYERFVKRALPEAGYVLIHQPSVVDGTLFPTEVGAFTCAQSVRTDLAETMHTISVGHSCIHEDDLETIIVLLAHEMAHRVREHILVEHYYAPATQEGLSDLIRAQEREADRIALLVLRDERYAKAQIKKFAQEIDRPYIFDTTGRKRTLCTDGSTTHPPHQERIRNALNFWIELVMQRDGLSEQAARALVAGQYQAFLAELNLQESTIQQLSQILRNDSSSKATNTAFRLLRAAPQIMEQPDDEKPFKPLDGSFTHIMYAPEQASCHMNAVDLSIQEPADVDGINELLASLLKSNLISDRTPELLQLAADILAPRYTRFLKHSLSESGYLLVHQPSVASGTLFQVQRGDITESHACSTDIADLMHSISLDNSLCDTEELDSLMVILAHELAHRVREHLLEEFYTHFACAEDKAHSSREQEREADRIALLVLREERYIKACIRKFAHAIDHPYFTDRETGAELRIITEQTDTHPSYRERISNALEFWVELVMKRDELSAAEARARVTKAYQSLLSELNLQESTLQQLSQLL